MLGKRACAALAALASIALPILVRADPPQPAAVGSLLPSGAPLALVLEERLDSATTLPGTQIRTRLRQPLLFHGVTVAPAGARVWLTVTQIRRASPDVDGEIFVRVGSIRLADGADLPLSLPHYALSAPLVAANRDDVAIPGRTATTVPHGLELLLPPGTVLRARTAAAVDASDPHKLLVVKPPPYTLSTDTPYSAFTPIPLMTYNPLALPPTRRGRPAPTPAATASPTDTPPPLPSATPG